MSVDTPTGAFHQLIFPWPHKKRSTKRKLQTAWSVSAQRAVSAARGAGDRAMSSRRPASAKPSERQAKQSPRPSTAGTRLSQRHIQAIAEADEISHAETKQQLDRDAAYQAAMDQFLPVLNPLLTQVYAECIKMSPPPNDPLQYVINLLEQAQPEKQVNTAAHERFDKAVKATRALVDQHAALREMNGAGESRFSFSGENPGAQAWMLEHFLLSAQTSSPPSEDMASSIAELLTKRVKEIMSRRGLAFEPRLEVQYIKQLANSGSANLAQFFKDVSLSRNVGQASKG